MKVWILDDAHFPTGFANGAVKNAPDSLRRQSLVVSYLDVPAEGAQIRLSDIQEAQPWQPSQIENFTVDPSKFPAFHDDELVSVVAIRENGVGAEDLIDLTDLVKTSENGEFCFRAPKEGDAWRVAILHLTRNRGPHRDYINMMDKKSCRLLIDAVYEPHFAHYGELFGTTIAGFFSDEPEIGNGHMYEFNKKIGELDDQAWSSPVGERLQKQWGEDYRRYLPLIWDQKFDKDLQARVRRDYMDAVSLLVKECFSFQVGDWCRAHGVKYIGHLIEDDHQHTRTGSSLGHYFRGLAGQDWAGVDDIGGQVLPQGETIGAGDFMHPIRDGEFWHYTLGKLGGSMAAIDPIKHGNAMCEAFGNYGWSEGVRLEKYIADHLMVRGINNYVPHAFTAMEFPDPDCPPHFYAHGHNPQYRHFGALMKYMNRICTLISGGKAVIPAAVLYNAEADWTGDFMFLQKPAIELYDHQIDYHFIPADVFQSDCSDPAREGITRYETKLGSTLKVGGQEYRALIIPYMEYIPQAAAEAAAKLIEAGCPVFFVQALPAATIEGGHSDPVLTRLQQAGDEIVASLEELADRLKQKGIGDAELSPASTRIRVYHYCQDKDMYLIVNEGTQAYRGTLRVPGEHTAVWYDAWSNTVAPADIFGAVKNGEAADENTTGVSFALEPLKSLVLVLDETEEELFTALGEETPEEDAELTASDPGRNPSGSSAAAFGPAVLHLDGFGETGHAAEELREIDLSEGWTRSICKSVHYPEFAGEKTVNLPDALGEEELKFSGFVRYEKTVDCGEKAPEEALLVISDAYEGVEVFVNGVSLGIQIVPEFRYELGGFLKAGENVIRIEVATTLEREAQDFPQRWAMPGMEKPPVTTPSGINGTVKMMIKGERK